MMNERREIWIKRRKNGETKESKTVRSENKIKMADVRKKIKRRKVRKWKNKNEGMKWREKRRKR